HRSASSRTRVLFGIGYLADATQIVIAVSDGHRLAAYVERKSSLEQPAFSVVVKIFGAHARHSRLLDLRHINQRRSRGLRAVLIVNCCRRQDRQRSVRLAYIVRNGLQTIERIVITTAIFVRE